MGLGVGVDGGGGGALVVGSEAGLEDPEPPPGEAGGPELTGAWLTAPEAVAVVDCLSLAEGLGDVESLALAEAEPEASDAGLAGALADVEAWAEDVAPGEALGLGTSSEPADCVRSPVT
ncbi:hypothetical protein ACFYXS_01160 [Streptomyces sp. NPDC002574]|uniref:hypothetical protein n=1 Tax=Streptomyces sp. NPDC002574 TaxID=3364652 RepID=UPI0036A2D431